MTIYFPLEKEYNSEEKYLQKLKEINDLLEIYNDFLNKNERLL